jgi:hypothetical protein
VQLHLPGFALGADGKNIQFYGAAADIQRSDSLGTKRFKQEKSGGGRFRKAKES